MLEETACSGEMNGLKDRHSFGGAWTLLKLAVLENYLSAFTVALKNQNFRLVYVDAFAGTGRCDVKMAGSTTTVDGSARIALQVNPPFDHCCFMELAPKKLAALQSLATEYSDRSIEIIHGDANSALRDLCGKFDWRNTRAVLFLDPYGLHVEWATLQAIADTKAIDVWYLFPYSGLYRQAAKKAENIDPEKEAAITRILGTDDWRKKFYEPEKQLSIFGDEGETRAASHSQMLKYVSERLKGVFPAVSEPKIFCQSTGAPLFALYFAASNPSPRAFGLAIKIAKGVINAL